MLRNPLTWLLLFIASSALAACCGSVACDCQDSLDNAVFFNFNLDPSSPTRFDSASVGTVFIVRQLLRDTARRPTIDTVALVRPRPQWGNSVVLNNTQPFPQRGNRKLDRYFYTIYLGTRRAPTTRFKIDSVKLNDRLESDGCCTCNRNIRKLVYLNGQTTPQDLTDPAGKDQPVPVLLNR